MSATSWLCLITWLALLVMGLRWTIKRDGATAIREASMTSADRADAAVKVLNRVLKPNERLSLDADLLTVGAQGAIPLHEATAAVTVGGGGDAWQGTGGGMRLYLTVEGFSVATLVPVPNNAKYETAARTLALYVNSRGDNATT